MKTSFLKPALAFSLVLTFVLMFSGCNLFDKADDITFPATLEVTWTADEDGDLVNHAYSKTATVKLSDNAEIARYNDKIKSVEIEKITYRITEYSDAPHNEAVIMKNGFASFSSTGSSTPILEVPYAASAADVNLKTTTSDTDLNINAGGLTDLANIFKAEKELKMTSTGVLSRTPVSFTVVSTFHVKITAEILD